MPNAMRMPFLTQAAAQAYADALHQRLIASNPAYAASVRDGQTTAWAKPYQDRDKDGQPLNATWYVNLKDRCLPVVRENEREQMLPYRKS